eukprot:9489606-Pyramimonas_sp.AAC.1
MGYSSDDSDDSYKVDLSWLDKKPSEDVTQTTETKGGDGEEPNWLNDYKVSGGTIGVWVVLGLRHLLLAAGFPRYNNALTGILCGGFTHACNNALCLTDFTGMH